MRKVGLHGLLFYTLLTLIAVAWAIPLLWMFASSVKPEGEIMGTLKFLPSQPTLDNFRAVFTKAPIGRWLFNSFLVSGLTTAVVLIVDAMAGYAFARLHFPGREVLFFAVIATMMVPQQVVVVPLYILLNRMGLINTYPALIAPKLALALGVFLMRQFFLGLPKELEEAASIDGANRWTVFSRVLLPQARPALSALAIFTFTGSWNDFLWPLVATTKESMYTLTVGLANFAGTYRTEYGPWLAAAVFASLPMLVIFLLLQRQFVKGITLTGIKG